MLSEDDLELLDALQVNPRASWTLIGQVLGIDPVTAARRWARLRESGMAWVSVTLGPHELDQLCVAVVEVQCEPGANAAIAATLARWDCAVTVQHVAGTHDLFVVLVASDFATMSGLSLVDLPAVRGVTRIRSHFVTRLFATGRWRLHALNKEQVRRLREAYPQRSGERARPFGPSDRALFRELSTDGRRTCAEVGERVGLSARTVQRRLTALMARRELAFRCDVARTLLGWPSSAVLWLNVPDARIEEAGRVLGRRPEVRTCAAVADERNLLLTIGLRHVADLHEHITGILQDAPYARIMDRNVVLRQEKLYGRILDRSGRAVDALPIDPWTAPASVC
ncbi:DNA-binding Lrp family transcriptional regulator [Thermocatellispora tengchongensis]|uniref:DNA-binding Lrp family transcriptional regulator n=1 Tax=Thermocatellispora tengchongensis TaxID=1073253 RepID=A0A840PBQ4_9ACTN|nr:AsnC family transcriptional regulator [Thermocatellispora tengchongensis]MBB5136116.1 DNA-binding Lrp family transcriptional regulator [Thermocatellispora tengchongensis]